MTTDPAGRVALKPCPFCGSEPYEDAPLDAPGLVHIGCFDCGIDFNAVSTEEAITAWNTRASDAEIERLRSALSEIIATVQDPNLIGQWDRWRRYISKGGKASWPRDEFESLIDSIATDAQAALTPAPEANGE